MCGNTGVQMGGWFRKEMNSADDFKGLKMRIPGLGGDVLAKLGASPVSLPGGQIYENLISGAIDATEWVGPWNDAAMKFYEAAKYYYYPGMHEPGPMLAAGLNKDFWEGLSKSDKVMVEAAASMENDVMMAEFNANNGASLAKLLNEQGVQLKKFNDDIYDSFGEAAEEVFAGNRRAQRPGQANPRKLRRRPAGHRLLAENRRSGIPAPAQPRYRPVGHHPTAPMETEPIGSVSGFNPG